MSNTPNVVRPGHLNPVARYLLWVARQHDDYGDSEVTLDGSLAIVTATVQSRISAMHAAATLLKGIHAVVKAHPGLTEIRGELNVMGMGWTDRYGNKLDDQIPLCSFTWNRCLIEDIAKYQTAEIFACDPEYQATVLVIVSDASIAQTLFTWDFLR